MTEESETIDALRTIITDAERLRDLASKADAGMLAFLLENVLHEARATLIGMGHEPTAPKRPAGRSSAVQLVRPSDER